MNRYMIGAGATLLAFLLMAAGIPNGAVQSWNGDAGRWAPAPLPAPYSLPVAGATTLGGVKGNGTTTSCAAGNGMTGWNATTGAMTCNNSFYYSDYCGGADTAYYATEASSLATDPTACSTDQYVSDMAASGALTCSMPSVLANLYNPTTWETPAQVGATSRFHFSGLKDNSAGLDDGYWNTVVNVGYGSDSVAQHQLSITNGGNLHVRSAARTAGSWGSWTKFAKTSDNVATATALAADPSDCSGQFARGISANGSPTCADVNLTSAADITGTLPVGNGGTGATSVTQGGAVYGSTTSAYASTAAGTDNTSQFLMSNGTSAPAWALGVQRVSVATNVSTTATTATTVMSFVLQTAYTGFHCSLPAYGTATSAPRFSMGTSSYAPFVQKWTKWPTSATTPVYETINGTTTTAACTSGCQTGWGVWEVSGQVTGTAGNTVYLYLYSSTSGQTVNVEKGAFCIYY